jgi:hypothetical protein
MVPLSHIENMFPCQVGADDEEKRQCEMIRRRYIEFAAFLAMEVPLGMELTLAFQRLQESFQWSISGVSAIRRDD